MTGCHVPSATKQDQVPRPEPALRTERHLPRPQERPLPRPPVWVRREGRAGVRDTGGKGVSLSSGVYLNRREGHAPVHSARRAHSKPRFHGHVRSCEGARAPWTRRHLSPYPRVLFPVVAAQSIDAPPLSGQAAGLTAWTACLTWRHPHKPAESSESAVPSRFLNLGRALGTHDARGCHAPGQGQLVLPVRVLQPVPPQRTDGHGGSSLTRSASCGR